MWLLLFCDWYAAPQIQDCEKSDDFKSLPIGLYITLIFSIRTKQIGIEGTGALFCLANPLLDFQNSKEHCTVLHERRESVQWVAEKYKTGMKKCTWQNLIWYVTLCFVICVMKRASMKRVLVLNEIASNEPTSDLLLHTLLLSEWKSREPERGQKSQR